MASLSHTTAISVRHQTVVLAFNLLFVRPEACPVPVEKSSAPLLFQDSGLDLL